jgi:hypothetical protein
VTTFSTRAAAGGSSRPRAAIGAAITHACLALARDRGLGRAVLTSSPDGHGIYRRLGFRDCCTVSRYRYPPAS